MAVMDRCKLGQNPPEEAICYMQNTTVCIFENLYSPHNSDSSSDKINTKLYNKNTKNKLN